MIMHRVLIVDDSQLVRKLLHEMIATESDFTVVGAAENGHEAIEVAERSRPDLIILDLAMPLMTGIEAAPHLLKAVPAVIIILFTLYEGPTIVAVAKRAGIHSVTWKGTPLDLLPHARAAKGRLLIMRPNNERSPFLVEARAIRR